MPIDRRLKSFRIIRGIVCGGLAWAVLALTGSSAVTAEHRSDRTTRPVVPDLAAAAVSEHSRELIAFLERRLQRDPGDADVYSKLAGLYLQRLRETGSFDDLSLALRAARASLAIVPAVRNTDGLICLTLAEFAAHQFGPARDHARELARLDDTGTPYALLGDALAELGDYGAAEHAYRELQRRDGADNENAVTRVARLAQLHGNTAAAEANFSAALALELTRSEPSPERLAWFYWQLGDTAFFAGDERRAETNYNAALSVDPGYFRALASQGRLRAAHGDFHGAISAYEAAVGLLPDPTFIAELGDVYKIAGRDKDARQEYQLVEFIGHLSTLNGVMYNRQLALFHADHGIKLQEAYEDAKREYRIRRDILGADALAWTALKAGHLREAQAAMTAALRLGSRDPRLFYHAGMVAQRAGQRNLSRAYLRRALTLNPKFDPLQASAARRALQATSNRSLSDL